MKYLKNIIIAFLQRVLGYENYLFLFVRIKLKLLSYDRRKKEYLYFESRISTDANVVVIGASIGITTFPFAIGNEERNIFAFEPTPSNQTVLERLKKHYNTTNVHLFDVALGNESKQVEMILPEIYGAQKHGLTFVSEVKAHNTFKGEKFNVLLQKLDGISEMQTLKIDALKIVAENYELQIIKGAMDTIVRDKPFIYCELWNNELRESVFNCIKEVGYDIYFFNGMKLVPYTSTLYLGKNFYFKHPEN